MKNNYAIRRQWMREEAHMRTAIRPLRNAVNKALKASGIKHSKYYKGGRIKGTGGTTEGWETESQIWSQPHSVTVKINATSFAREYDHDYEKKLADIAETALAGFEYVRNGNKFEVYPTPTA